MIIDDGSILIKLCPQWLSKDKGCSYVCCFMGTSVLLFFCFVNFVVLFYYINHIQKVRLTNMKMPHSISSFPDFSVTSIECKFLFYVTLY